VEKKDAIIEQPDDVFSAANDPVQPESRWETAEWSFYTLWRCVLCPFDTLEGEDAMMAHWLNVHTHPAPVVTPSVIQVYDHRGNPK
jgi:hypothetical protein